MLLAAENSDIIHETLSVERAKLEELINCQVFDTPSILQEDDCMYLLLNDALEEVWGKFHTDRYGWNPLKKHELYFVSLVLKGDHIVFTKEKTTIQSFIEKVRCFVATPSVINQPIIYRHKQPRHCSELLYFDSPSSFFFFISTRGYTPYPTSESTIYNGPDVFHEEVTDGSRKDIAGRKRCRRGVVASMALPPHMYSLNRSSVGPCYEMSIVDYRSFLFLGTEDATIVDVAKKYLRALPIYTDPQHKNKQAEINSICIKYLPYLLTAILANVETDLARKETYIRQFIEGSDKLPTATLQKRVENDVRISFLINSFSSPWNISKAKICKRGTPDRKVLDYGLDKQSICAEHLQYMSLWVTFFKGKEEQLAKKYKLSNPIKKHLSAISKAENLNLLVFCMESEENQQKLIDSLYSCSNVKKEKPRPLYYVDYPPNTIDFSYEGANFHSKLCRIIQPRFCLWEPLDTWADGQIDK